MAAYGTSLHLHLLMPLVPLQFQRTRATTARLGSNHGYSCTCSFGHWGSVWADLQAPRYASNISGTLAHTSPSYTFILELRNDAELLMLCLPLVDRGNAVLMQGSATFCAGRMTVELQYSLRLKFVIGKTDSVHEVIVKLLATTFFPMLAASGLEPLSHTHRKRFSSSLWAYT
ncbi:hypothetical protein C8Q74DRAFT_1222823 [Fomes fomentarius]|nr:hypothetical protein C8Q74DRAFT_1222823 [Fomes fomentarius]